MWHIPSLLYNTHDNKAMKLRQVLWDGVTIVGICFEENASPDGKFSDQARHAESRGEVCKSITKIIDPCLHGRGQASFEGFDENDLGRGN